MTFWLLSTSGSRHGSILLPGSAGEYLKEAAMRLESGGIKAEKMVREGAAAENIVQYAQEKGIDLIIMGTRGQGGIQRFLLGSTTDRVLRTGHLPVLVVPPEE